MKTSSRSPHFPYKSSLRTAAALTALGAANIAAAQTSTESATLHDAEHQSYLKRYETLMSTFSTGDVSPLYDPLGLIAGADSPSSLPRGENAAFSQSAIDDAIAYAAKTNSAGFWIIKDGKVIAEEYFNGAGPETLLISRSLSKPMAVVAIGRAIAGGHIKGLDQPASDFFIEWKDTPKEAITIRQLLDMRSGLARQQGSLDTESVFWKAYLHPRHDEIIISDYPLEYEPGSDYGYANANSELIAPIIERATGDKYEHWLSEEVLSPLGAPGGVIWLNRIGGTAHSGCCMKLPMESWAKLAMLIANDGVEAGERLLPKGFVAEMRKPLSQNPYAGMGVYLGEKYVEQRGAGNPRNTNMPTTYHSEPYLRADLYLFDGNANQVVYFLPSEDLVIMRLGDNPPKEIRWDNAYLPNLLIRDLDQNH